MKFDNKPALLADGSVPADYYDENYWERGAESGKGSYNGNAYSDQLDLCKHWAKDTYDKYGPFKTYLELGCGRGWAILGFLNMPELVVKPLGIDISHYAIMTAHPDVRRCLLEHDISDLQFLVDSSVDFIFSNDVLEHLTIIQIYKCLLHCARIAKHRIVHLVSIGDGVDHNGVVPNDQDQSHINMRPVLWWADIFMSVFSSDDWLVEYTQRDRTIDFIVTKRIL